MTTRCILSGMVAAVLTLAACRSGGVALPAGLAFAPFTSDADNAACVLPADAPPSSEPLCDPVNVLFLDVALADVADALTDAGWSAIGSGSEQRLALGAERRPVAMHAQLFREESASERFHIRLWETQDGDGRPVVIGAVHHEAGRFRHQVDRDWEAAEAALAHDLCDARAFRCARSTALAAQAALQDGGVWRGWANDVHATVIRPAPAPNPD